jgi:hypothetical protein
LFAVAQSLFDALTGIKIFGARRSSAWTAMVADAV